MADGDLRDLRPAAIRARQRRAAGLRARGVRAKSADDVSSIEVPEHFIEELYTALNPDVGDAVKSGRFQSPYAHWLAAGMQETQAGKRPLLKNEVWFEPSNRSDMEAERQAWFLDMESYLYVNPDVREAVGDKPEAARAHWLAHGRLEQRRAPGVAPFSDRRVDFGVMAGKPFGLNVFGPFMAPTGLGTACRNMLAAIKQTRLPFEVWNLDVAQGPARMARHDKQRLPRFKINIIFANADQIEALYRNVPIGFFNDAYPAYTQSSIFMAGNFRLRGRGG